ncbi:MAG: hypothetical protein AB4042_01240, partial [Leptolyngbyaceae cyanobacterium]
MLQRRFDRYGLEDFGYGYGQDDSVLAIFDAGVNQAGIGDAEKGDRHSFELPGSRPHYNPDRPGQVNHILLELDLDIPHRSYQGICHLTLTPVQSGPDLLHLNAVDLNIDQVLVEDTPQ